MRSRWLIPLCVALAMAGALGALRAVGFRPLAALEARAFDARLTLRGKQAASDEVVVVSVDDASLAEIGRWPWTRPQVGDLLARINAGAPKVIGVDLVQSEPTAGSAGAQDDTALVDSVRAARRIVLGYYFDFRRAVQDDPESPYDGESAYALVQRSPGADDNAVRQGRVAVRNLPALSAAAAGLGYFNFMPESDGLYRRATLAIRFHDRVVLPLSLAMLQFAWPDRPTAIRFGPLGVESVRIGDIQLPVRPDGQMLINYRGPAHTFHYVSAADVLTGRTPPEVFRDKYVVLGISAIAVADIRATPVDGSLPGVEIHATLLDNILRREFIAQPTWSGPDLLVILALSLLLGAALPFTRGFASAALAAVVIVGYLALSQYLFTHAGLVLAAVSPALAGALTYTAISLHHFLTVDRENRRTRRTLEMYLSPALARYLSERPEMLRLGGEKSERSVLFSDLQGFTKMSEGLAPEQLVLLLNEYLGDMTDCVFGEDGMLDKYVGDGVMAVWGAPVAQADHALRACRSALAMVDKLAVINARNAARGWPTLRVRIGLNSGPMVFGNMGSAGHLSLTVMGDNVNLGARLEGINKYYGSTIIASEATVVACGDALVLRELDRVRVRGRAQAVRIYEVLGLRGSEARWAPVLEPFARGLAAFRNRDWDTARAAFEATLRAKPQDGPSEFYLRKCEKFAQTPPDATWEAVTSFEEAG
ncbi:MAG: adenylate/guanylate cyclase domain-containing protein [Deltaproteobacteria bacterium]|nr:adenylate/guanylate cyclase domain-containing protein [Deltaproteobacteria bacterium]